MKHTYAGRGAWLTLGMCLVALAVSCGCGKPEAPPAAEPGGKAQQAAPQTTQKPPAPETSKPVAAGEQPAPATGEQTTPAEPAHKSKLEARIETSMGNIVVRLAEDKAPNTVANFVHLASKGFYDGVIFHRVINGFMIQSGCPEGTGFGGPGWRIADEFSPSLRHLREGVLSMAKTQAPDTGGSQFFITLRATPNLDGKHAVFGQVVDGMDVVRAIGAVKTGPGDRPLVPPQIKRIVLLRDGVELTGVQPEPQKLPDLQRRPL